MIVIKQTIIIVLINRGNWGVEGGVDELTS